jgi:aminoglycoside phosphotransferase (APT) family kinase protein
VNAHGNLVAAEQGRVPEVDAVLARLGLGRLGPAVDLATFPGRNENWAGTTDAGHRVFVKRFGGSAAGSLLRLRRSVAFQRLAGQAVGVPVPRQLGCDEPARLLVSEFVDGGVSGTELAASGQFGTDLAGRAGGVIGSLHRRPAADVLSSRMLDGGRPVLPSLSLLRGLTLRMFYPSTAGELKAWRLMQQDEGLIDAVRLLLEREETAIRVPAHCDLRLDQFLLAAGQLYVIDAEEFRLADPARDIGGFAGEFLYPAVTGWTRRQPGAEPQSTRRSCGTAPMASSRRGR